MAAELEIGREVGAGTASPTEFYRVVLQALSQASVPHLVGGAYALAHYTRAPYQTKDLDVFLRRGDLGPAFGALRARGYCTEDIYPHFLGKVYDDPHFVDLIFGSGNGAVWVDDGWFEFAAPGEVFGLPVLFCPVEEILWSKAFIMERERFDGADVAHLLLATGGRLDWDRLLDRFGDNWRVLLAHLVLFGYIYPGRQGIVPDAILERLLARANKEPVAAADQNLCRGGLLSRQQYLHDLGVTGMRDARLRPAGRMSREEIDAWTDAGEGVEERRHQPPD
jgi:hypothetical protein